MYPPRHGSSRCCAPTQRRAFYFSPSSSSSSSKRSENKNEIKGKVGKVVGEKKKREKEAKRKRKEGKKTTHGGVGSDERADRRLMEHDGACVPWRTSDTDINEPRIAALSHQHGTFQGQSPVQSSSSSSPPSSWRKKGSGIKRSVCVCVCVCVWRMLGWTLLLLSLIYRRVRVIFATEKGPSLLFLSDGKWVRESGSIDRAVVVRCRRKTKHGSWNIRNDRFRSIGDGWHGDEGP